jgi:hypothetical protein
MGVSIVQRIVADISIQILISTFKSNRIHAQPLSRSRFVPPIDIVLQAGLVVEELAGVVEASIVGGGCGTKPVVGAFECATKRKGRYHDSVPLLTNNGLRLSSNKLLYAVDAQSSARFPA